MKNIILLVVSLMAAATVSVGRKYYSNKINGSFTDIFIFNAACSGLSAVILAFWGIESVSLFTLLFGIAFGLITASQYLSTLKALQMGPMSYTNIIVSFSMVIPAVSGALLYGETLGVSRIVGVLLTLVSFVMAVEKDRTSRKANAKWLLLCLAAFLGTGGIGVMQKIHQNSPYRGELNAFLVIAFVVSFVFSATLAVVYAKKSGKCILKENLKKREGYFMLICIALTGVGVALNNKFNLYLSGVMDSAVFFPVVNGVGIMLSTAAAVILFKEKLTKKQWLGIVVGILAVICLCNPLGI